MGEYLNKDGLNYYHHQLMNLLKGIPTNGILYGEVDSTSTSTAYTATISGLTSLYDGVTVLLKNGVVTSAAGFTININDLGAKPVYTNLAAETAETTKFNVAYTLLFIYDSTRVEGGCWICYNGYDSNTNTIGYQLRTNSSTLPASDKGYRYRLWFTSADETKWVPANKSSSTNATAKRTPNTTPIDPFGPIIYYGTNGTTNAGANLSATNLWEQYAFSLGYSFNDTGAALELTFPAPVYIKCTPQANGSALLNDYTQSLPTTKDGFIYIFIGIAYSATNVELRPEHPVYWHDGSGIRLWMGSEPSSGGSTVSVQQTLTSGTEIAGITVDGTQTKLYAPTPPVVEALTDQEIEDAVDACFTHSITLNYSGDNFVVSSDRNGQNIVTEADTGAILYFVRLSPTSSANFSTNENVCYINDFDYDYDKICIDNGPNGLVRTFNGRGCVKFYMPDCDLVVQATDINGGGSN